MPAYNEVSKWTFSSWECGFQIGFFYFCFLATLMGEATNSRRGYFNLLMHSSCYLLLNHQEHRVCEPFSHMTFTFMQIGVIWQNGESFAIGKQHAEPLITPEQCYINPVRFFPTMPRIRFLPFASLYPFCILFGNLQWTWRSLKYSTANLCLVYIKHSNTHFQN